MTIILEFSVKPQSCVVRRVAVTEWFKAVTRLLDVFSLHLRRYGYLGASGQNPDSAISISSKTCLFPLSDDVYGINLF